MRFGSNVAQSLQLFQLQAELQERKKREEAATEELAKIKV